MKGPGLNCKPLFIAGIIYSQIEISTQISQSRVFATVHLDFSTCQLKIVIEQDISLKNIIQHKKHTNEKERSL